MQIALNIGQLKSFKEPFDDTILKMIVENKLSNIETYMTSDNYNKYIFNNSDLLKLIEIVNKLNSKPPLL